VAIVHLGVDPAFRPPPIATLRCKLGFTRPAILHVGHTYGMNRRASWVS
jgi:hypothetical protein